MQKRIFSRTGILRMHQSILLDADSLWQRFGCEEKAVAEGYEVVHFDDDMKLRRYYEFECQDQPDVQRIMVIDRGALYVPIDIAKHVPVIKLSLQGLFPTMDCDVLTELPGLDFDHLAFIMDQLPLQKMDKQQTWKFCTESLRTAAYAEPYAKHSLMRQSRLRKLPCPTGTGRPWPSAMGKLLCSSIPASYYVASIRKFDQ